jgi:hypothetical protein
VDTKGRWKIVGTQRVDVRMAKERQRKRPLTRVAIVLLPLLARLWTRLMSDNPVSPGLPQLSGTATIWLRGSESSSRWRWQRSPRCWG